MIVLHDFLTDSNGAVSASSEDSNNPVQNVKNTVLFEYFSFTGNTSEIITFSFDTAITIDAIGMVTNMTDSGTVTIEIFEEDIVDGGSASSVGTDIVDGGDATSAGPDILDGNPDVDDTIVINASDQDERGIILQQFDQSYTVTQIRLTFADSSNSENIQVKRLVFGDSIDLGKFQPKLKDTIIDNGIGVYTPSGALYGTKGLTYVQYKWSFADLTRAQRDLVKTWMEDVGVHTPFFIDFTEDATLYKPDYVGFEKNSIALVLQNFLGYTGNVTIRQAF